MKKMLTSKIIQILFTTSIILSASSLFAFIATYTREYEFFPYAIFSFEGLWLWGFGFLYAVFLSSLIVFPLMIAIYWKKIEDDFRTISILMYIMIIALCLMPFFKKIKNFDESTLVFLLFLFFIAVIISLMIIITINNYKKKKNLFKIIIFILVFIYLIFIFSLRESFIEVFKRFLIAEGLAAKNVEIYLKDENKFVEGILRFKDSKYAYVEFQSTKHTCDAKKQAGCEKLYTFKRQVPVENVAIIYDGENKE